MSLNQPVRYGQIINSLSQAYATGSAGLNQIPSLLIRILQEEMWRKFVIETINEPAEFDFFTDFVAARPPKGLGGNIKTLFRICWSDGNDPEDKERRLAYTLLDAELKKEQASGGNFNPNGVNQHTPKKNLAEAVFDNVKNDLPEKKNMNPPEPRKNKPKAPTGNSREYAVRTLSKNHPELLKEVLDGGKTLHQALIETGKRKHQFMVQSGDPQAAAKQIAKWYGAEGVKEIIAELSKLI